MAKRKAATKRAARRQNVAKGKRAAQASGKTRGSKTQSGKKTTQTRKRKPAGEKRVQPRVWRRAARLAEDALTALEAGDLDQVRQYLQSIHAVAVCADET